MLWGDTTAQVIFLIFTVLAAVGAYLLGARFHSRRLGALFALGVVAFFVVLHILLGWLLATYGSQMVH
ncbi:MAG TPA: hypothetical protein VHQ65_08880 [Thermoanaerobaculia bacterium]|nr:hypothetical protein [Thermoanaerobaculia bacterium]